MMILCLDVGNSHIFGGIFQKSQLKLSFRYPSIQVSTSDQIGVFLKSIFRENGFDAEAINEICICSVVPHIDYSLRSACVKYFNKEPLILKAGVKTGLRILTKNPQEVGADRIANCIAAAELFPKKNIIVIDFGTATSFCALNAEKDYFGGPILPGMRISMESLTTNAAKLSSVNIVSCERCLGQTTTANIQAGLYFGQLGAVKEITHHLNAEVFQGKSPVILATGGFAYLFEREGIFTAIIPDLVLQGLHIVLKKNIEKI